MRLCSRATLRSLVPGLLLAGLCAGSGLAQQSAPADTSAASAPAAPASPKQKRKHAKPSAVKAAKVQDGSATAPAGPAKPAVMQDAVAAPAQANQPVTTSFGPVIRAPQATGTVAQGGESFPTVKPDTEAAPLAGRRSSPDAPPGQ